MLHRIIPPIALLFLTASHSATPLSYTGRALNPETGEFVYTEEHEDSLEGEGEGGILIAARTLFRDPKGLLIAQRNSAYAGNPWHPVYYFNDLRDGYEEGAEPGAGTVRVYMRRARGKPLREKILKVPDPWVVDGGFNRFIKDHWDELTAGKIIAFNFVAPARLDYFAFEVFRENTAPIPAGTPRQTFVVRPAKAAIRLLVAPIRVAYVVETRRMREYAGLSNIDDARGKNRQVKIIYSGIGP